MSIKIKRYSQELSKTQRENLEANFRKLWLMEKVHGPFMVHTTKIEKMWNLPMDGGRKKAKENILAFYQFLDSEDNTYYHSDEFRKIAPIVNSIANLQLPRDIERNIFINLLYNLPSLKFKREISELQKRFCFEKFWYFPLFLYIVTGKIYTPYEVESKAFSPKKIPEHIIEDWKIFLKTSYKEAQHKFLKKQGIKKKEIAQMDEDTDELPSKLIHNNLNIAQEVWGDWEDGLDDNELKKMDRKMQSRVKKRYERFRKLFVSLSDEDMRILKSLKLSRKKK